jgi:hypothetical protein
MSNDDTRDPEHDEPDETTEGEATSEETASKAEPDDSTETSDESETSADASSHEDASESTSSEDDDGEHADSDKDDAPSEEDDSDTETVETESDDEVVASKDDTSESTDDEALASKEPPQPETGSSPPDTSGASASGGGKGPIRGIAAFFDRPDDLLEAAREARDSSYEKFDTFSPFPIHGIEDAMGLGRSWIPWVTFGAGMVGFLSACALQFGTMTFDWPMIIGGKPYAPWPSFVPVMFELTVLIGGVTTALVMLKAAGCFEAADVIDPELTNDRFALWISSNDSRFEVDDVVDFMEAIEPTPVEIRTIRDDE